MLRLRGAWQSSCRHPLSRRIVKNDAERVPVTGAQPADAVAQVDAIRTLAALYRTVMHGEHHRIALPQRHHLNAALHARALFGQRKLATGKILSRLGEQHRRLQGKSELAV